MPVSIKSIPLLVRIAVIAMLGWLLVGPVPRVTPAAAQGASVSVEFRTALEPYGSFQRVARWGEVWVPRDVPRQWRPYTVGRWVNSEDYGWYWVSDQAEAPWGWITFHYGRWVWIDDLGWAWIPGSEWGPAWVDWRRGGGYVGWAPLPPDDVIVEVRDDPQYWIFVRPRDFLAIRLASVVVRTEPVFFRDTVVVNETVRIRDRGFAVNPGIEPAFLAAEIGRPIPQFQVRPRVLAGTAQIAGAIQVRAEDLRRDEFRRSIVQETNIQQTNNSIRPAANVPQPQPLGQNEHGRLGQNPPRAAAGVAQQQAPQPGATGTAPEQQQRERGATGPTPEQQRGLRERGPTTGATPPEQQQQRERGATGPTPEQQRGLRERGPTTGATPPEQRQRERGATGPTPEQQRSLRERGPTTGATPPEQRQQRGATGPTPEQQRGRSLYDRAAPGPAPQGGLRERGGVTSPPPGLHEHGAGGPPAPHQPPERGSGLYNRAAPGGPAAPGGMREHGGPGGGGPGGPGGGPAAAPKAGGGGNGPQHKQF